MILRIVYGSVSVLYPSDCAGVEGEDEDSQSLDTKLKLMSDIKLEMEALMGEIKTKIHNTMEGRTVTDIRDLICPLWPDGDGVSVGAWQVSNNIVMVYH